jgi:hypothetical protein
VMNPCRNRSQNTSRTSSMLDGNALQENMHHDFADFLIAMLGRIPHAVTSPS